MFKLILKFQDRVVDEYTFDKAHVTVGRRDDNDVAIDNMAVSGHHLAIETEQTGHHVIIDLESLNGTFINDRKISRDRLADGDLILVGKHVLEFIDLAPKEAKTAPEEPRGESEHVRPEAADVPPKTRPTREGEAFEQPQPTEEVPPVELEADEKPTEKAVEAPVPEVPAEAAPAAPEVPERPPKRVEYHAALTIFYGAVPEIIELEKSVTTIGKSEDCDVKCSGLLVGKTAAVISKRPYGFFLEYKEGMKKPEVNDETVTTQVQLRDGDKIQVGSLQMEFSLKTVELS